MDEKNVLENIPQSSDSACADAWLFCPEERLARLLEIQLDAKGIPYQRTVLSKNPPSAWLWLIDLDYLPLFSIRHSTPHLMPPPAGTVCIAWSQKIDGVARVWGSEMAATFGTSVSHAERIFLHRPFSLVEFDRLLCDILSEKTSSVPHGKAPTDVYNTKKNAPLTLVPDGSAGYVIIGENRVLLSPYEWIVFGYLWRHRGTVVSRATLQSMLAYAGGNMSDVYICHLRKKLEKPFGTRLITTVRGEGYIIDM